MGRRGKRRSEFGDVSVKMPWQIEGIILCIIPLSFAFGIWQIIDEVNGKSEVFSQALGITSDWMPILFDMRPWIVFVSIVFAVKNYWKFRRWLLRQWNAVG